MTLGYHHNLGQKKLKNLELAKFRNLYEFTDFPCVIALAQNVPIPPNHIPLGYSSYDDQSKLLQKGRKQKEVKAPSEKTACTAF